MLQNTCDFTIILVVTYSHKYKEITSKYTSIRRPVKLIIAQDHLYLQDCFGGFFIYEELQIVWAIFMQGSQLLLSRSTFPEILCHIIKSECIRDETWSTKPHFSLLVSASSFEQDFTINTYLCNNLDSSTLPHLTFGM